jgi:hypothetical protein
MMMVLFEEVRKITFFIHKTCEDEQRKSFCPLSLNTTEIIYMKKLGNGHRA